MSDAFVTLQGWVGNEITFRETERGRVANFRVGSTPRIRRDGGWVDGDTSWFSVACWRGLADNVRDSVRKGDPVVVHGRLRADVWRREDGSSSVSYIVDAVYVGHDLNRGTATFLRNARPEREAAEAGDEAVKEILHAPVEDLPQLDSFGQPRESPAA